MKIWILAEFFVGGVGELEEVDGYGGGGLHCVGCG